MLMPAFYIKRKKPFDPVSVHCAIGTASLYLSFGMNEFVGNTGRDSKFIRVFGM